MAEDAGAVTSRPLSDHSGVGWATDFAIATVAAMLLLYSKMTSWKGYPVFFAGTILAYGFGGAGHILAGSSTYGGFLLYYCVMTAAWAGNALRASFGWKLPLYRSGAWRRAVLALWTATAVVTAGMVTSMNSCVTTYGKEEYWMWANRYEALGIAMALIEIWAAVLWGIANASKMPIASLLGVGINCTSWAIVKGSVFMAPSASSFAHMVYHYFQIVLLFVLHISDLRQETPAGVLPRSSSRAMRSPVRDVRVPLRADQS